MSVRDLHLLSFRLSSPVNFPSTLMSLRDSHSLRSKCVSPVNPPRTLMSVRDLHSLKSNPVSPVSPPRQLKPVRDLHSPKLSASRSTKGERLSGSMEHPVRIFNPWTERGRISARLVPFPLGNIPARLAATRTPLTVKPSPPSGNCSIRHFHSSASA